MAITLRSRREIDLMRESGKVVADVLLKLQEMAEPGISTGRLNEISLEMAHKAGAEALFKGVRSSAASIPFPGAICASINEQIVHGIPSNDCLLKEGDIVSIDFGIRLNGYCGDSAVTVPVGSITEEDQRLVNVTREVLDIAVKQSGPGIKWSQVATVMQAHAEDAGFSVVKDFVGHGIGRQMHEEPKVPNYVSRELLANDILLKEGMILAVEPMVNAGGDGTRMLRDGWTVVTRDMKKSAHFEHTIAIVADGCEVLTSG